MQQTEYDKVVNRFLLSALYCFFGAIILVLLYRGYMCMLGAQVMLVVSHPIFWWSVFGVALALTICFCIRRFCLKKGTLYYAVLFLIVALGALYFLFAAHLDFFWVVKRRFLFAGGVLGVLFLYELVIYLIRSSKWYQTRKKKAK